MAENPYQSPPTRTVATRPTRWMVRLGIVLMVVAVVIVVATIFALKLTFESASQSSAASPSQLAEGIQMSVAPIFLAAPVGLLGIIFVIAGAMIRHPTDQK